MQAYKIMHIYRLHYGVLISKMININEKKNPKRKKINGLMSWKGKIGFIFILPRAVFF